MGRIVTNLFPFEGFDISSLVNNKVVVGMYLDVSKIYFRTRLPAGCFGTLVREKKIFRTFVES
jgi:hypothetical protein